MSRILLGENDLTLGEVQRVAKGTARASLGTKAAARMRASREVVLAALAEDHPSYGVNTGFGHLVDVRIPASQIRELQYNLLRSHSAGVGEPLGPEETRAVMLLRAHALARGHSGARPEIVRRLLDMLNANLLPRIPSQGSVGASGDLAPLAHLALTLIGEGEILRGGRDGRGGGGVAGGRGGPGGRSGPGGHRAKNVGGAAVARRIGRSPRDWRSERFVAASAALRAAGLRPLRLEAKEGLSLINGTQVTTAIGVLALLEAETLLTHLDISGAMSLEALKGSIRPFDERIQRVRPHRGQQISARNLRALLAHSQIMESHRNCGRIQDSYALRCMPQVHGAGRNAAGHVREILEIEVNSSTDNPLVFAERQASPQEPATTVGALGLMIPGGNFHGQPVAAALDYLALAMTGVASICERRIERLVNPALSGLPPFLVEDSGLNSGLMMAQVTAAALVSENKVLSHPASVDSIPTSGNREDHVPMAPIAARKAAQVVANARRILAIEVLAAAQALDFLAPLRPARAVEKVHRRIRRELPHMKGDRVLAADIAIVEELIVSGALRAAAEEVTGELE